MSGPGWSVLETFALGLRRAQDRDDGEHRVYHYQRTDIDVGPVDAIDLKEPRRDDRDKAAAIDLRDLIASARSRRTIARGEILRIESRDRAVAEAEHEAEPDDVGECRQPEVAR